MAGIQIAFASDVRSFLKGTKDIEGAMDDVGGSLDDVGDLASTNSRKIWRELSDAAREGERASERLERTFRQDFDKVADHAKDAGRKVERATKDSTDEGGKAVGEFKDEARQNFSEVASSFSGDMASAGDLVQGTLGGLASSLPGWGGLMAGGMAIAGGAMFTAFNENAAASEQRIGDMFDNMIASGVDFVDRQFVVDELAKIYNKADDAAIAWDDLTAAVELTGLSQATVARAFAGDASAGLELTNRLRERQAELNAEIAARPRSPGVYSPLPEDFASLDRLADQWNGAGDAVDDARERVQDYREAVDAVPTSIDTEVSANVQLAQAELERFTRQRPRIPVAADPTQMARDIDRELAKPRTVKIGVAVRPGTTVVI